MIRNLLKVPTMTLQVPQSNPADGLLFDPLLDIQRARDCHIHQLILINEGRTVRPETNGF